MNVVDRVYLQTKPHNGYTLSLDGPDILLELFGGVRRFETTFTPDEAELLITSLRKALDGRSE